MIDQAPVCVGVIGHRVLAELPRLAASVDQALDRIASAFPERPLVVVTALAEGADRIVANQAVDRQGALIAVLPLSPEDYESDFGSPASRDEFRSLLARAKEVVIDPTDAGSREAAYERAGRVVLDRSDALIAVWDGSPAQGQGGTADIVAEARVRGLPLAWVHAGNREPGTDEPTSLGATQGLVTWERL